MDESKEASAVMVDDTDDFCRPLMPPSDLWEGQLSRSDDGGESWTTVWAKCCPTRGLQMFDAADHEKARLSAGNECPD